MVPADVPPGCVRELREAAQRFGLGLMHTDQRDQLVRRLAEQALEVIQKARKADPQSGLAFRREEIDFQLVLAALGRR